MIDLLVIGGGINGAGIARDAAGRGLAVTLVERDDLAAATSSWSSKLIHGGLRYLEQYEFRLVREALQEREVLLRLAPHIIRPLRFVLPHVPEMRPAWMIRAGMLLYDHLGGRISLPGSRMVAFPDEEYSAGLKPGFERGYLYSDCRVDDSRLTVINAMSARDKGATILTRTRFEHAKRVEGGWEAIVAGPDGGQRVIRARGIVNAAGPWVMDALARIPEQKVPGGVRLVKGSHVIVPRVHDREHALILQNPDKRVIFVIPYEGRFSLIGTTDVAVSGTEAARRITDDEADYLMASVNRYLARPLSRGDVVSSYAGVRPLYDDGSPNPSEITRDYVLRVDHEDGGAPLLSIFGGKITTYRRLAEEAMQKLAPFFPAAKGEWTRNEVLPGGAIGEPAAFHEKMRARYAGIDASLLEGVLHRHGSNAQSILGEARQDADLGKHFGAGLTEAEIAWLRGQEWAVSAEDILWRRTRCGLHMDGASREAVRTFVGR